MATATAKKKKKMEIELTPLNKKKLIVMCNQWNSSVTIMFKCEICSESFRVKVAVFVDSILTNDFY